MLSGHRREELPELREQGVHLKGVGEVEIG